MDLILKKISFYHFIFLSFFLIETITSQSRYFINTQVKENVLVYAMVIDSKQ